MCIKYWVNGCRRFIPPGTWTDLKSIADEARTSVSSLMMINSDHKRLVSSWYDNPDNISPGDSVFLGKMYTVQPGDSLSSISSMFLSDVASLKQHNPQIQDEHLIQPGDEICVVMSPINFQDGEFSREEQKSSFSAHLDWPKHTHEAVRHWVPEGNN
jgi:hypothetical protein